MLALLLPTSGGLGLALLLDSQVRGANVFKSVFYLPICLSAVVVGQIWVWIYQPDWGLLNTVIGTVTGEPATFAWLARPQSALYSVIVAWSLAADGPFDGDLPRRLTAIPSDLLEAAAIEGATRCRGRGTWCCRCFVRPRWWWWPCR